MPPPCIGFEIGLGHICWYFRAYICSKILKVLHPCIGFGIGLGHIWGHANAWIWYIHAYAWILYIHVLSHISHIPKAEIFGFMFQYLSSERMGLRFWANPIHNTWLDHGEISRTRCTPNRPAVAIMRNAVFGGEMEVITIPFIWKWHHMLPCISLNNRRIWPKWEVLQIKWILQWRKSNPTNPVERNSSANQFWLSGLPWKPFNVIDGSTIYFLSD